MKIWYGFILILLAAGISLCGETAVLAFPEDSFLPLAREIAAETGGELIFDSSSADWDRLILVGSPEKITMEYLLELGRIYRDEDWYPAAGIITGESMESARDLWRRGYAFSGMSGESFIAGDSDKHAGIVPGRILSSDGTVFSLDGENMADSLARARFFYWSRHVSKQRWFWHNARPGGETEEGVMEPADIPLLNSPVIYAPACGSVAPWFKGNVALAFLERGAACYAGHVLSPLNSGMFMGEMAASPPRYSWKEFPLGLIVQVQNRASGRMVFKVPNFFLLGNPGIYSRDDPPYRITGDSREGNTRFISGESDVKGILPVKVEKGASFEFVKINGTIRCWSGQAIFNKNVNMLNLGDDLYLLYNHGGGPFSLELREAPPLVFRLFRPLVDSLDYVLIWLGASDPLMFLLSLLPALVILTLKGVRGKLDGRNLAAGFAYAAVVCLYIFARQGKMTAVIYGVSPSGYVYLLAGGGFASTFAAGLQLFRDGRRIIGKIAGTLTALLPLLLIFLFLSGAVGVTNLMVRSEMGDALWNGTIPLMAGRALMVNGLFFFLAVKSPFFRS